MTHEEIRARLLAAMDRTLDPQETDEVERHVEGCDACRLEQVELHRMRRSMDREEDARTEAPRPGFRFGPLGPAGMARVLILGGFTVAAMVILWKRHAPPSVAHPAAASSATVEISGSAVLMGRPGRLREVLPGKGPRHLPEGEVLEASSGGRVLAALPGGGRVVMEGPSSGSLEPGHAWRVGRGRALFEASGAPLRIVSDHGALILAHGMVASWEAWETPTPSPGLMLLLLDGEAVWEGADGSRTSLLPGVALRVVPGTLKPEIRKLSAPSWVEDLKGVLSEEAEVVIPVRVVPERP